MGAKIVIDAEFARSFEEIESQLGLQRVQIARIATALAFRMHSGSLEVVAGSDPKPKSAIEFNNYSFDPESQQLYMFRLLAEHRTGRRLDQSDANSIIEKYMNYGIALLHEALLQNDGDKYRLLANLHKLAAGNQSTSATAPAPLFAGTISQPVMVLGHDAKGTAAIRPNRFTGLRTNPHLAIVGKSGVGKTQAALALLDQMLSGQSDLGCIILDYKGDITAEHGALLKAHGFQSYTAGHRSSPLPLNPLYLPPGEEPATAGDNFAERTRMLKKHFGDTQVNYIAKAAQRLYEETGLFGEATITKLHEVLKEQYELSNRKPDSALGLIDRLASRGVFQEESGLDPKTFLQSRIIIDFSQVEGLADAMAFFVLNYIINGMKQLGSAPHEASPDGTGSVQALRTILFIDEAQNYLGSKAGPVYWIARTARSFGIALWLSSQQLADFESESDDLVGNLSAWLIFQQGGVVPTAQKLAGLLSIGSDQAQQVRDRLTQIEKGHCFVNLEGQAREIKAVQLWDKANWPAPPPEV